jgi:predicted Fe-Mo cluster-binding NifX family protein
MIMAKIAISSEGPGLDEALDSRFGRAAGFIVVDPQTLDFVYLDNGSSQAMAQGAGIQAAEIVANSGAKIVLTGYVGPKAFMALQAAGIRVGQNLANMTVREALETFINDKVEWSQQPNRRGHGR